MRWLRNSLGLKIWLMVWLLVLLVPTWRQDAREQWNGDKWDLNALEVGLPANEIQPQNSDDLAAQLETVGGRPGIEVRVVQGAQVYENKARIYEKYAALSRRFPRENAVRQAWLLDVTQGPLKIESVSSETSPAMTEKSDSGNWLPKSQLEAALGAAREGAKVEPQNSFFPWMESAFLFALQREAAAVQALERAAKCSYFDDGTLETARRRLELRRRVQSVRWNDKARAIYSLLLPHFGKLRATARAALEISRREHERGDAVHALQIAVSVARAGATLSTSKSSLITVLVGDAIQNAALHHALKNVGREAGQEPQSSDPYGAENQRLMRRFQEARTQKVAAYARELKQDALAQQVLQMRLRGQFLSAELRVQDSAGLYRTMRHLARAFWVEAWLMWFSVAGAIIWLLTRFFARESAFSPDSRRASTLWAAACVGATAVLLGIAAVHYGFGSSEEFRLDIDQRQNYEGQFSRFVMLIWLFPVAQAVLQSAVSSRSERPPIQFTTHGFSASRVTKILIYGAFLISGALIVFVTGVGFDSIWSQTLWPAPPFVLLGSVLAASAFHIVTAQGKKRLAALLFWSVPWLLLGASRLHFEEAQPLLAFATLAVGLGFLYLSAHLAQYPASQPDWWLLDAIGRLRVLVGTLAVAGAVAYIGVRLVMWPAEDRVGAQIETQLREGEVTWLEIEAKRDA